MHTIDARLFFPLLPQPGHENTKGLYLWQNLMATKLKEVYPDSTYTPCLTVQDCTEQNNATGMSESMEYESHYDARIHA